MASSDEGLQDEEPQILRLPARPALRRYGPEIPGERSPQKFMIFLNLRVFLPCKLIVFSKGFCEKNKVTNSQDDN